MGLVESLRFQDGGDSIRKTTAGLGGGPAFLQLEGWR